MPLTDAESTAIANVISPIYNDVSNQYDFGRYPANVYNESKLSFSDRTARQESIASALLWKYGRYGRENYPQAYTNLIHEVTAAWPDFAALGNQHTAQQTFNWWRERLNRNTVYITVSYITHLVHHEEGWPIIDQHNFRAMNNLVAMQRPGHRGNLSPSTWNHIEDLKGFMHAILPKLDMGITLGDLDRFLMMYGRHYVPH